MLRCSWPTLAAAALAASACTSAASNDTSPEPSSHHHAGTTTTSGGEGGHGEGGAHGGGSDLGGAGGHGDSGGGGGEVGGAGGEGGAGGDVGGGGGVACSVSGYDGTCIDVSACADIDGYQSTPGFCPGPADIQCCAPTPDLGDNPAVPAGYQPMMDADVTPEMTDWAVMILHDPADYPMFSTALRTFGSLDVLARVEWHPPDFQNATVHRGVTLYEPQ